MPSHEYVLVREPGLGFNAITGKAIPHNLGPPIGWERLCDGGGFTTQKDKGPPNCPACGEIVRERQIIKMITGKNHGVPRV